MQNKSNRNYYVFRIAKGFEGGEPTVSCPIDMEKYEVKIKEELKKTEIDLIPYQANNFQDYLHRELWHCGKLRQGWGIKGLDLRLFETNQVQWIENFIIGAKKYWGAEITDDYCHVAVGRYNILKYLREAKAGDIVFIPKHSCTHHHDENRFSVCEVVGEYFFDLDEKYQDFGHTIIVKKLRSYEYSENTLLPGDFSGYRKALGKVNSDHQLFTCERFEPFINQYDCD